jgi:oxygen-independent coproporphyrinogen-3 oxidase
MNHSELLKKYDVPVPRYTSYPTVPYWSDSPTTEEWVDSLRRAFVQKNMTWSMYVHVPFCETLCTFCGCNTVIGKNHEREQPYVGMLLKEFAAYKSAVPALLSKPL